MFGLRFRAAAGARKLFYRANFGLLTVLVAVLPAQALAHSGGLNAQGCHAGSQPYHCQRPEAVRPAGIILTYIDKDWSDFCQVRLQN